MSHVLHISEDHYSLLEQLAKERHQNVEDYLAALLDAAWEEECAKYDAAFENDPSWIETAEQAAAGQLGPLTHYASTEEFFRALGASEEELEAARRLDQSDPADQ